MKGVRAVAEELEVRLAFDAQRNDNDIAAAAIDRLAWDTAIPRDAIIVQVESGWLTLAGQVGITHAMRSTGRGGLDRRRSRCGGRI